MIIIFLCLLAWSLPFLLMYSASSLREKCSKNFSLCSNYIGDFSLSYSMLKAKCSQLKSIKAVTYCNAIVGRDGLPYADRAPSAWGEPFSVYTSSYGEKLHLKEGCCGATHVQHIYTMDASKLSTEKFCLKCRRPLHPDLIPFLQLRQDCNRYLKKASIACDNLKKQIQICDNGFMKILCWRKIKRYKTVYTEMLSNKTLIVKELSTHFKKGYIGLKGCEFYHVCYSKHAPTGTDPHAPYIAALKPLSDNGNVYQLLRLGFPNGGYILYDDSAVVLRGKECYLLDMSKDKKRAHYIFLPEESFNLLPPSKTS